MGIMKFSKGDIVALRSGSMKMTITDINKNGRLLCTWAAYVNGKLKPKKELVKPESVGMKFDLSTDCY